MNWVTWKDEAAVRIITDTHYVQILERMMVDNEMIERLKHFGLIADYEEESLRKENNRVSTVKLVLKYVLPRASSENFLKFLSTLSNDCDLQEELYFAYTHDRNRLNLAFYQKCKKEIALIERASLPEQEVVLDTTEHES